MPIFPNANNIAAVNSNFYDIEGDLNMVINQQPYYAPTMLPPPPRYSGPYLEDYDEGDEDEDEEEDEGRNAVPVPGVSPREPMFTVNPEMAMASPTSSTFPFDKAKFKRDMDEMQAQMQEMKNWKNSPEWPFTPQPQNTVYPDRPMNYMQGYNREPSPSYNTSTSISATIPPVYHTWVGSDGVGMPSSSNSSRRRSREPRKYELWIPPSRSDQEHSASHLQSAPKSTQSRTPVSSPRTKEISARK